MSRSAIRGWTINLGFVHLEYVHKSLEPGDRRSTGQPARVERASGHSKPDVNRDKTGSPAAREAASELSGVVQVREQILRVSQGRFRPITIVLETRLLISVSYCGAATHSEREKEPAAYSLATGLGIQTFAAHSSLAHRSEILGNIQIQVTTKRQKWKQMKELRLLKPVLLKVVIRRPLPVREPPAASLRTH